MKKRISEAGSMHSEIQPFAFVDDNAFVTKSGEVGVVLTFSGPDSECREPIDLAAITERFESARRTYPGTACEKPTFWRGLGLSTLT